MQLVDQIYDLTSQFHSSERYNLASQMNRAVVSIPSNISEGRSRGTRKDYVHFLRIAFASGAELETQVLIAKNRSEFSHLSFESAENILDEVMRMLNKLICKLSPKSPAQARHRST
jgi:four helix bundle protein